MFLFIDCLFVVPHDSCSNQLVLKADVICQYRCCISYQILRFLYDCELYCLITVFNCEYHCSFGNAYVASYFSRFCIVFF